jgi:hypothetical protein
MTIDFFEDPNLREAIFPPSIRPAPYDGIVEGGSWIAIPRCITDPLDSDKWADIWGSLVEASEWWADETNQLALGVGDCPDDALGDLITKTYHTVLEYARMYYRHICHVVITDQGGRSGNPQRWRNNPRDD